MLFPDPGDIPATATVVATVAPTSTCCPPGRRCTSSPRWLSCLMWTSSCRDTTQDTQMTSNGEKHTHAHTLTVAHVRCNPTGTASTCRPAAVTSATPPPHLGLLPCCGDRAARTCTGRTAPHSGVCLNVAATCTLVQVICWIHLRLS